MSKKDIETKLNYYLLNWKETKDPQWAMKIMDLYDNKNLIMKAFFATGKLGFKPKSDMKHKCEGCGKYYLRGEPCFFRDNEGWHENCAPPEFKQLPYYLSCKENDANKSLKDQIEKEYQKADQEIKSRNDYPYLTEDD